MKYIIASYKHHKNRQDDSSKRCWVIDGRKAWAPKHTNDPAYSFDFLFEDFTARAPRSFSQAHQFVRNETLKILNLEQSLHSTYV